MRRLRFLEVLPIPRTLDGRMFFFLFLANSLLLALQNLTRFWPDLAYRFLYSIFVLGFVFAGTWTLIERYKSRVAWNWFFAPVLYNLAGALFVGLLARMASKFVAAILGLPTFSTVVFSLTPLLAVIVLGWTVDKHSQLPQRQADLSGWVAVLFFAVAWAALDWAAMVFH